MKNRVKQRRHELSLTQTQLEQLSGVPRSTIANIEDGRTPALETAIDLARALQTTVEELFII